MKTLIRLCIQQTTNNVNCGITGQKQIFTFLTITFTASHYKMILIDFSLTVKAAILISVRDLAISSTHEGKTGNINCKTEDFNCLIGEY